MSVDGKGENKKKLLQADEIQHKTQGALHRIEREVEGTVVLGSHTLDQLRAQGEQMVRTNSFKMNIFVMFLRGPIFSRRTK